MYFVAVAMALIDPGDQVIISEPTFGVYRPLFPFMAPSCQRPAHRRFRIAAGSNLGGRNRRTKMIIICAPNNPTGNLFSPRRLTRFATKQNAWLRLTRRMSSSAVARTSRSCNREPM